MGVPDNTYIDNYINDGQKESISLKNFYNTLLTKDENHPSHVIRIPIEDFFIKYRDQLKEYVQLYAVPQIFFYQPKSVSFQLYETTELWLALLRLNNMINVTEFHRPWIQIYDSNAIKGFMNIIFKRENRTT